MLPSVSNICEGKDVDFDKLILRIRKTLHRKALMLVGVCRFYKEIISRNPRMVVDIGCGLGVNLSIAKLYASDPFLLGIDKNLCFLEALKRLSPEAAVILADASMLPLRKDIIDLALCTVVLHELPDLRVIDEVARILKSNGVILILDVVLRFIPSILLNAIRSLKIRMGYEPEIPYTLKEIKLAMELREMRIAKIYVNWKFIITGIAIITAIKEANNRNS